MTDDRDLDDLSEQALARIEAQALSDAFLMPELDLFRTVVETSGGLLARVTEQGTWSRLTPPPHVPANIPVVRPAPWASADGVVSLLVGEDATLVADALMRLYRDGGAWVGTVRLRADSMAWRVALQPAISLDGVVLFCLVIGFPMAIQPSATLYLEPNPDSSFS